MTFNGVDIYTCKFFTLNKEKDLVFWSGKFKGRSSKTFTKLDEILEVMNYCFWIIKKNDTPLVTKYLSSAFLKEITAKLWELEKRLKKKVIEDQKEKEKEAEESTKIVGQKHI